MKFLFNVVRNKTILRDCKEAIKKAVDPRSIAVFKASEKVRSYLKKLDDEIDATFRTATPEAFHTTCGKLFKAWIKMDKVYKEKTKKRRG